MWSVRMRARGRGGAHVSGAEGLFEKEEMEEAVRAYAGRALGHPRGRAADVVITLEQLRVKPREIRALPLRTLRCRSPREAKALSTEILRSAGISRVALRNAFSVLRGRASMRGAALIAAMSGKRLEPDSKRGVRASRLGIARAAHRALSRRLRPLGLDNPTVKEALVLASKVASARGVAAELCVSDDPDYTTGYLASSALGYVRLPNIKTPGSGSGGRVFFINAGAGTDRIIRYLEQRPVLITEIAEIEGVVAPEDLIRR
jgi:6-carboxyhexanoate--CoA ligase